MPTSQSRRRSDDDIDPEIMALVKDEQAFSESSGSKYRRVKVNVGESWLIRFLPVRLGPQGTPFVRIARHWVGGKPVFCKKNTAKAFGGNPDYNCPLCAVVDRYRENKDEETANAARKAKADPQWMWYCAVKEIEKGSSTETKPRSELVKAYEVTFYKTLANELLAKFTNSMKRQRDGFTHLTRGNDFVLARGKKNLSLDKMEAGPIFETTTPEKLRAMTDALIADAEAQFKEPTFPNREKVQDLADKLEESLSGGRRRSRRDNDFQEDDEDEKPRRTRRSDDDDDDDGGSKPARSSRRPVDDDDEDEKPRGRRPVASEDDDDEDAKPVRKRAPVDDDDDEDAKPAKGRRAPVDDDDDDDDDEDDEEAKPKRRAPANEDDDDDEAEKPKRRAPVDDDEDEAPRSKKPVRRVEADEEDAPPPARTRKPPVAVDADDDDDDDDEIPMDDKPKKKAAPVDDDEGDEDDEKPAARPKPKGPPPGANDNEDDDEDDVPEETDDDVKPRPLKKGEEADEDEPPAVAAGRKGKLGDRIKSAVRKVNDRD